MEALEQFVKTMIEISETPEDADKVITQYYNFKTVDEKITFLKKTFDVQIVGHDENNFDSMSYYALLQTIISSFTN